MSTLHQLRQRARQGVGGTEYQIRTIATTARAVRQKGTARNHARARTAVALTALALPLTVLASAGPASASTTPTLQLTDSGGDWVVSGSGYTPGLANVQLWIQDVTSAPWTTLEYQSGVHTSLHGWTCINHICTWSPGGALSAQDPKHPLVCYHSYEALTYDPTDGWTHSNIWTRYANCIQ